ncbi:MAG: hypothetical protein K0U78_15180 [Actinomycetia bacterium]|nr:hypothetical protein [Actinomycetes bacterium]
MSLAISDPSVVINNEPIGIAPGTVKYTEGFGESNIRAQSTGNGNVTQIFSRDVTTNFSTVKISLYNDIKSINLARSWKALLNENLITVTGVDTQTGESITRTFPSAAVMNDYEVEFSSDAMFELEFKSLPAL